MNGKLRPAVVVAALHRRRDPPHCRRGPRGPPRSRPSVRHRLRHHDDPRRVVRGLRRPPSSATARCDRRAGERRAGQRPDRRRPLQTGRHARSDLRLERAVHVGLSRTPTDRSSRHRSSRSRRPASSWSPAATARARCWRLRLTAGGRLDGTLRGRRRRAGPSCPSGGIAQSLAVQPNGRILLGGSNANENGRPMVLARLRQGGGPATRASARPARCRASSGIRTWRRAPGSARSCRRPTAASWPSATSTTSAPTATEAPASSGSIPVGQPAQQFGSDGHTEVDFELGQRRPGLLVPLRDDRRRRGPDHRDRGRHGFGRTSTAPC